jgi:hypothetical protein
MNPQTIFIHQLLLLIEVRSMVALSDEDFENLTKLIDRHEDKEVARAMRTFIESLRKAWE